MAQGAPFVHPYPSKLVPSVRCRLDFTVDAQVSPPNAGGTGGNPAEVTLSAAYVAGPSARAVCGDERDAQTCAALRVQSADATPAAGGEAALRELISGVMSGSPSYDNMSPVLADAIRQELPTMLKWLQPLGAVQSVEFRGVGRQGDDVYKVRHENGLIRRGASFSRRTARSHGRNRATASLTTRGSVLRWRERRSTL